MEYRRPLQQDGAYGGRAGVEEGATAMWAEEIPEAWDMDILSVQSSEDLAEDNKSSGSMSESMEGLELPVWLGGCEKWVTGLTKRTTCDDVIYALVAHNSNPNEEVDVTCYCIFERWRDVERPLRGRTKIMKVWRAWGDEGRNVRFSVRKVDIPADTSSEISRSTRRSHRRVSARERRSREKTRTLRQNATNLSSGPVWRKDYGPIDGHNGYVGTGEQRKAQAFHELVQLVIEQEKKIQDQFSRLRETDTQIENYETKMHELRMRENGENYVQEAYLRDRGEDSSSGGEELFPAIKAKDLEAYMHMCENILDLEDRINSEHSRILDISQQIQEESILEPPPPIPPRLLPPPVECREGAGSGPLTPVPEDHMQEEIERLQSELQRSQSLTEAQQHQLKLVEKTMTSLDSQIQQKSDYVNRMLYEINIAENATVAPPPPTSGSLYGGSSSYQDRHSSSTSGVSEVSELESSDRSTSRSRQEGSTSRSRQDGSSSRSRARTPERSSSHPVRDNSRSRDCSRERSLSAHHRSVHGGSTTSLQNVGRASERATRNVTFSSPNASPSRTRERSSSLSGRPASSLANNMTNKLHHSQNTEQVSRTNGINNTYGQTVQYSSNNRQHTQNHYQYHQQQLSSSKLPSPHLHQQYQQQQEDEEYYVTKAYYPPPSSYRDAYLNQSKTLSDDSNSDTGLSSLHSDEAPPILETLV